MSRPHLTSTVAARTGAPLALALALTAPLASCRAPGAVSAASSQPVVAADPSSAAVAGVHPDVASLGWLVGRWTSPSGLVDETWTAAGDALFGVSFELSPEGKTKSWEVMIVRRDPREGLVFAAMPAGRAETVFRVSESGPQSVTFSNPGHDFPKYVRYARRSDGAGERLDARISDDHEGLDFPFLATKLAPAPELVAADGRFAGEVASRGADAWVEVFDPQGGMGRPGGRIEGAEAIRAAMQPVFGGGKRLEWSASASGLSPAGDLGFTVGPWRALAPSPGGLAPTGRGAYVTVWRRGADGIWRVLYDVGDPEPLTR